MMLYETLKHKYPELEADKDYLLRADENGNGYIAEWRNNTVESPTMEGLQSYWDEFQDAIRDMFKPKPSQIDIVEQTQTDLIFQLMMNGVI